MLQARQIIRVGARPCDDEVRRIIVDVRKRLDQQVAAFFVMQPPEKKEDLFAAQLRKRVQETFARLDKIDIGPGRTIIHHRFVAFIWRKGFSREPTFFFRGKQDGGGIFQNAMFNRAPVKHFFQMLQWIGAFKPRIEHAMRKNEIRGGATA